MSDDDPGAPPPREYPGYRVIVHHDDGTEIDITHAVGDVYDIAVGSMDFGSGFLDNEEVGNLRALGNAIGAKRFDYQRDKCLRCGRDYELHTGWSRTNGAGCFCHLSVGEHGYRRGHPGTCPTPLPSGDCSHPYVTPVPPNERNRP